MAGGNNSGRTRAGTKWKTDNLSKKANEQTRSGSNSSAEPGTSGYPQQTKKSKTDCLNKNNSKRSENNLDLDVVLENIFPPTKEILAKKVKKINIPRQATDRGLVQKQLIEQFDQIDEEFDDGFTGDDLVEVAVDAKDDEQYPENSDSDSESEADLNESVEQIVDIPFDQWSQQSKPESEVILRNTVEDFESLRGVPAFETFIKKVVAQEIRSENKTQIWRKDERRSQRPGQSGMPQIKSLSDTTIYVPAFNHMIAKDGTNPILVDGV